MPAKAINYQNNVIYKIEHVDKPELFYIGVTTEFTKRKAVHKSLKEPKGIYKSVHQMIQDNGGFDAFMMIEIKKFPCADKREADAEAWRLTVGIKQELLRLECLSKEFQIRNQKYELPTPIKAPIRKLITCKCGSLMYEDGRNKHVGTSKHMKYEAKHKEPTN